IELARSRRLGVRVRCHEQHAQQPAETSNQSHVSRAGPAVLGAGGFGGGDSAPGSRETERDELGAVGRSAGALFGAGAGSASSLLDATPSRPITTRSLSERSPERTVTSKA